MFFTQLTISALVAVATPALAAGLMTGVSATGSASDVVLTPTIATSDAGAGAPVSADPSLLVVASHGPARLSALAGDDDAAWSSAHAVHVEFAKRKVK
jgi:hypothetical protein